MEIALIIVFAFGISLLFVYAVMQISTDHLHKEMEESVKELTLLEKETDISTLRELEKKFNLGVEAERVEYLLHKLNYPAHEHKALTKYCAYVFGDLLKEKLTTKDLNELYVHQVNDYPKVFIIRYNNRLIAEVFKDECGNYTHKNKFFLTNLYDPEK